MKKQFSYSLSVLFLTLVSGISISIAAQTSAAPDAKAGATGASIAGKYCVSGNPKGFSLLEAAADKDNNLDFGVSVWSAEGANCGVAGKAKPVAGGWRYESGLASEDKSEHCVITLKTGANGDIVANADETASCQSACGGGLKLNNIIFPASSQQSKVVTAKDLEPETFFNSDCSTPANAPK